MKMSKLLQSVLLASLLVGGLAGCGEKPVEPTETPSEETSSVAPSEDLMSKIVFQDKNVVYDEKPHKLVVENLPKGAKVSYSENEFVEPGSYEVTAKVTLESGEFENFTAKLTIEKKESEITAEAVQEFLHNGEGALPSYKLNNNEQVISVQKIYTPGEHDVILYALESPHFKESNRVNVKMNVGIGNPLNIKFESKSVLADGNIHEILASNVPEGYHCEYENNKGNFQGHYNATCKVYDSSNTLALTLNALLKIDVEKDAEFEEYLDYGFADIMGNDYVAWNVFTAHPEDFGYEEDPTEPITWYKYEPITAAEELQAYNEQLEYYEKLKKFKDHKLSYDQQVSYKVLDHIFKSSLEYMNPANGYNRYTRLGDIDRFGGQVGNFVSSFADYSLRGMKDIDALESMINHMGECCDSYIKYANEKTEAGFPYSDSTLNEQIKYIQGLIDQGDNIFIREQMADRISKMDSLTDAQKKDAASRIDKAIVDNFVPVLPKYNEDLKKLKGTCPEDKKMYLASYGDLGKKEWSYELKNLLWDMDFDVDAYGKYITEKFEYYAKKIDGVFRMLSRYEANDRQVYSNFNRFLNGTSLVGLKDPNDMMHYLKNFATTLVPTLESTPEIRIKYMDKNQAEVSNAVAYYRKSALDEHDVENITINGNQLSSNYNDTLSTMAHEGYPGHLYAYVFSKQLGISNIAKIISNVPQAEGWATYVSLQLFKYLPSHCNYNGPKEKPAVKTYCDYLYYNDLASFLLYTVVDYNVHMNGWSVGNVSTLLANNGFNADAAQEIVDIILEQPTGYTSYGYGQSMFVDLHNKTKAALGDQYNEVEYNTVLQSHGWCSLGELDRLTNEYIEKAGKLVQNPVPSPESN